MIEIISIGTELLTGQTINTNASTIAKILLKEGYRISQITTVPDQNDRLKAVIEKAMERASILIITGGLGPTIDDITRHTLAEIFDSELIHDPLVAADLKKRYGNELETLEDQATIIKGAEIIYNTLGTAPGFILEKEGKQVIVLPGVPMQMQEMLKQQVIPSLREIVPPQYFQYSLYLSLLSEQSVDPYLRLLKKEFPDVEFGICPSYGTISIYLQTKASSQNEATQRFTPVLSALRLKFKEHLFSEKHHDIEYAIHELFISKKKTLACAESCTGGRMASRLTQISGSSNYFLGSLVTYSNEMKIAVLQVKENTLKKYGAVSRETVMEMVAGTLVLTGADYALSISGIVGPTGGTAEKPVGTVWCAIGNQEGKVFSNLIFPKGKQKRTTLIDYSTTYILAHLWRYIQFNIPPFEEQ